MPRYLSNGLAVLLFAGIALVGLAAWNLLWQDDLRSQTEPGDQTAQTDDDQPANIRIIGDETYIDGEKVSGESAPLDEPSSSSTEQNAVGGGPPDDAAPPINQQPQTTPQQQPTTPQQPPTEQPASQPGATGGVATPEASEQNATEQMTPEQRQAALDEREQQLDQRQQQLDQREQELDTRETELEEWQAELEDWEAELDDREAQLDDEAAALEESSALQPERGPPSIDIYDNVTGNLQRYEYDAPSGTVIQERPAVERPTLREPTPPLGPGEEEAPYWIFYDYY